jgi:hypothetical protein
LDGKMLFVAETFDFVVHNDKIEFFFVHRSRVLVMTAN